MSKCAAALISAIFMAIVIVITFNGKPPSKAETALDYLNANLTCWTEEGAITCSRFREFAASCNYEKRGQMEKGYCGVLEPQECNPLCRMVDHETAELCACCQDFCNTPNRIVYNY